MVLLVSSPMGDVEPLMIKSWITAKQLYKVVDIRRPFSYNKMYFKVVDTAMNFFLRELINRVISYLIRVSKGDLYEEKIEHLLKKSLLFTFMAFIFAATMTSKYLVANWYLDDLERSLTKVDTFMGTQQENMNQLFRINGDQYSTILKLTKENKDLRGDVRILLQSQRTLEEENADLKTKKAQTK